MFRMRCTLFRVRCTLFTVRCTMFRMRCTLFKVRGYRCTITFLNHLICSTGENWQISPSNFFSVLFLHNRKKNAHFRSLLPSINERHFLTGFSFCSPGGGGERRGGGWHGGEGHKIIKNGDRESVSKVIGIGGKKEEKKICRQNVWNNG